MKKIAFILYILTIVLGCGGQKSSESVGATSPEILHEKFVSLSNAFDANYTDLYADEAVIKNTRTYPNGKKQYMTLTGREYKLLIRKAMPLAKERDDISTYSNVKYYKEENGVRITADRYSKLKNYKSRISWLVAKNFSENWQIIEEISQSKP